MDLQKTWALYDTLTRDIPDLAVDEILSGRRRVMVRSGGRVGVAVKLEGIEDHKILAGDTRSLSLRELAGGVRSWNSAEASLGMAAVNAYWNYPEHPAVNRAMKKPDADAFTLYRDAAAGKKVAVIGHFHHLEQTLMDVCDLSILERRPQAGDYPDPACEYLLPQQDMIFATGVTFINKTIKRLLELSAHCGMILVGPSVPLCPGLFNFNVRDIQGFVVTDPDRCREAINGGACRIFDGGKRISVTPP
jgi:uncharacterized protein (DUF4213/DUF364 family)